jgi:hypothetical protein
MMKKEEAMTKKKKGKSAMAAAPAFTVVQCEQTTV